jgi:hypothetical protein
LLNCPLVRQRLLGIAEAGGCENFPQLCWRGYNEGHPNF